MVDFLAEVRPDQKLIRSRASEFSGRLENLRTKLDEMVDHPSGPRSFVKTANLRLDTRQNITN